MPGKNIYVVHDAFDNLWKVMQEDSIRSLGNFKTQDEARKYAAEIAKETQQEVIVHGLNGKFRVKNSYGDDPFPPKG